jgi:(1->4)-alpha-D-glucan 1-alpha-D-glucosylmutase
VDFDARVRALEEIRAGRVGLPDLMAAPEDGRIKLWVASRALELRKRRPAPFRDGSYEPVPVAGGQARRVCAFARRGGNEAVVALTGRFFLELLPRQPWAAGAGIWSGTRVDLPDPLRGRVWRDAVTGREIRESAGALDLGDVFAALPLALLES